MNRPLLVTADDAVLDELLRVAAAADTEADVAHSPDAAVARWRGAPIVLVGADLLDALLRAAPPRRDNVVIVGRDLDDATIWRRAVELGAADVAFLPDHEELLLRRLAGGHQRRSAVIGVVGGRGGAGASTLAAALALGGARRGLRALLVDTDPLGGGVDLLLGAEQLSGPRWPDLAGADAHLLGDELTSALPRLGDVALLSCTRRGEPMPESARVQTLVAAAARSSDLVVVDVTRSLGGVARAALAYASAVLVVVPTEVRACAAAQRVIAEVSQQVDDVRVVVRVPGPARFSPEDIADALGAPLAGVLRTDPAVAAAVERGELPWRRRSHLGRLVTRLLTDLAPAEPQRTAA